MGGFSRFGEQRKQCVRIESVWYDDLSYCNMREIHSVFSYRHDEMDTIAMRWASVEGGARALTSVSWSGLTC
jgi:hypothetical protein